MYICESLVCRWPKSMDEKIFFYYDVMIFLDQDDLSPINHITKFDSFFLESLYGQMHTSFVSHLDVLSSGTVSTKTRYQSQRQEARNIVARKTKKNSSYLLVNSIRRTQESIPPITPTRPHWPDNTIIPSTRKKFHCPRCNGGYTRLSDMKTHCQFQCGKEPRYQCPYCTKKAKFSSNMYVHVRRMHKNEKLQIIDLYKKLSRVSYAKSSNATQRIWKSVIA